MLMKASPILLVIFVLTISLGVCAGWLVRGSAETRPDQSPAPFLSSAPAGQDGLTSESLEKLLQRLDAIDQVTIDARSASGRSGQLLAGVTQRLDALQVETVRLATVLARVEAQLSVGARSIGAALQAKPTAARQRVAELRKRFRGELESPHDWSLRTMLSLIQELGRPDEVRPYQSGLVLIYRVSEEEGAPTLEFTCTNGLLTGIQGY